MSIDPKNVPPVATVDTPQFYGRLFACIVAPDNEKDGKILTLVANIDAHTSAAVAQSLQAQDARVLHLTHERDLALRAVTAERDHCNELEVALLAATAPQQHAQAALSDLMLQATRFKYVSVFKGDTEQEQRKAFVAGILASHQPAAAVPLQTYEAMRSARDHYQGLYEKRAAPAIQQEGAALDERAAIPEFFYGDEVTCCNEHGHIYHATVKKVEARWPKDRKPYFYYHVAVRGQTGTSRISSSEIMPESRAALASPAQPQPADATLVDDEPIFARDGYGRLTAEWAAGNNKICIGFDGKSLMTWAVYSNNSSLKYGKETIDSAATITLPPAAVQQGSERDAALSAESIVKIGYEVGIIGPVSDGNAVKFARAILAANLAKPPTPPAAAGSLPQCKCFTEQQEQFCILQRKCAGKAVAYAADSLETSELDALPYDGKDRT